MVVADYSTSVRIFEALREKTENKTQYDAYVSELKPVREELGINPSQTKNILLNRLILGILLKEEMWHPEGASPAPLPSQLRMTAPVPLPIGGNRRTSTTQHG